MPANHSTPRQAAVAGFIAVANVVDPIAAGANSLLPPPPSIRRPSPVSVLEEVLFPPDPKTKRENIRKGGITMIGHVPDNKFLRFARKEHFKTNQKYDEGTIEKTLRKHRT